MVSFLPCSADTEARRLAALHRTDLLDTPREAEFDAVVALASRLFDCPIATVSLIDDHRQWFKARVGFDDDSCAREDSPCATALYEPDMLVVEDMSRDPRFAGSPIVAGSLGARFYAGVPLHSGDPSLPGIGTLCIIDVKRRTFTTEDAARLRELATLVATIIRARMSAASAAQLSQEVKDGAGVIHQQNVQLRQAERMLGVGSWRLDLRDQSIQWSDHVYAIYGLPVDAVPDYDAAMSAYPPEGQARLIALIDRAAKHGEAFDFESDFRTVDGRLRRVRAMGEAQWLDGRIVGIVGLFHDVTDRFRLEADLQSIANTDALTGLPNRRAFEDRVGEAFAAARGTDAPLILMLLDLDGFKAVNDLLGHDAGDEVLRIIGARLRGGDLSCAFAARLGGDEFVLLFTRRRDCTDTERLVRTVLSLGHATVVRHGIGRSVSVTVGAATLSADVDGPQELLRRADIALYDSKRRQRGTGTVYGSDRAITSVGPGGRRLVSVA